MYYLITIQGKMISGRLISKTPPTQSMLKGIKDVGKKNEGEIVTVLPLTHEQLMIGAIGATHYIGPDYTEPQLIRMYLDNHE